MKKLSFILCFCLLINACKNPKQVNFNKVDVPKDYAIDIDNDGTNDMEINYKQLQTLDLPPSGAGVNGEIRFINQGAFFCNIFGGYSNCLSLEKGDTIKTDFATNNWNYYPITLISIGWHDGKWDKNWFIDGGGKDGYYVGFQWEEKFGYMKLDLNTETGEIKVLNSKLTEEDFLLIE